MGDLQPWRSLPIRQLPSDCTCFPGRYCRFGTNHAGAHVHALVPNILSCKAVFRPRTVGTLTSNSGSQLMMYPRSNGRWKVTAADSRTEYDDSSPTNGCPITMRGDENWTRNALQVLNIAEISWGRGSVCALCSEVAGVFDYTTDTPQGTNEKNIKLQQSRTPLTSAAAPDFVPLTQEVRTKPSWRPRRGTRRAAVSLSPCSCFV